MQGPRSGRPMFENGRASMGTMSHCPRASLESEARRPRGELESRGESSTRRQWSHGTPRHIVREKHFSHRPRGTDQTLPDFEKWAFRTSFARSKIFELSPAPIAFWPCARKREARNPQGGATSSASPQARIEDHMTEEASVSQRWLVPVVCRDTNNAHQ